MDKTISPTMPRVPPTAIDFAPAVCSQSGGLIGYDSSPRVPAQNEGAADSQHRAMKLLATTRKNSSRDLPHPGTTCPLEGDMEVQVALALEGKALLILTDLQPHEWLNG